MARRVNQNGLHEIREFLRTKYEFDEIETVTENLPFIVMRRERIVNDRLAYGLSPLIRIEAKDSVTGQVEDYTVTDNGLSEVEK